MWGLIDATFQPVAQALVLLFDMVLLKFFTQCAAIDAEVCSCFGLVVLTVPEHGFQHGLLDFGNNGIEQITGNLAVEIMQILANGLFDGLL